MGINGRKIVESDIDRVRNGKAANKNPNFMFYAWICVLCIVMMNLH